MRVEVEQLSPEWFELRANRIGGSQVAKLLGISPYGTAYDLFLEMMGSKVIQSMPHMQRGDDLEEAVRKWFCTETGKNFSPAVYTLGDYGISSLDGISDCETEILEIKCCNEDVFNKAKDGTVVPHYMSQLQWGFLHVVPAQLAHFVCYRKGEYAVVEVKPDPEYQRKLLELAREFHTNHVMTGIPPETSEKDYILVDNPEAIAVAETLAEGLELTASGKKMADEAKKILLELTDDGNCIVGPIKLTKSYNLKVDYKKACEDAGIDLEEYKTQVIRWTPRRMKS